MRLLRSRKALSTVVTTLIILVVSVLLASVVTLYAINVTTTRVQEESLQLTKMHIWYDSDGWALAGLVITNTGGRDVVIDKISVRGHESSWNNVYYAKVNPSSDLSTPSTKPSGNSFDLSGTTYNNVAASLGSGADLTLKSGETITVYIVDPDSISISDVGLTVGITVFTSNAQYYKEANVEATA